MNRGVIQGHIAKYSLNEAIDCIKYLKSLKIDKIIAHEIYNEWVKDKQEQQERINARNEREQFKLMRNEK